MKLFIILTTLFPLLLPTAKGDMDAICLAPQEWSLLNPQEAKVTRKCTDEEIKKVEHMMGVIDDLRKEISTTIHKVGNTLFPDFSLPKRDHEMINHVMETLKQAEHASLHALDKTIHSVTPLVGPLTRAKAHEELSTTALRYVGVFGLTMVVGNMIHYLMWGFVASGTLLMTFASTVPLVFSSVMVFPSVLRFLERLRGITFLTKFLSNSGISGLFEKFDNMLRSTPMLELIGIVTILTGMFLRVKCNKTVIIF
jgi:hypothetical protein